MRNLLIIYVLHFRSKKKNVKTNNVEFLEKILAKEKKEKNKIN